MISSLLRCVVCSCCFLSTVHHASASAFRPILSSLPPTRQLYATASLSPLSSAPACSSKHTAQPPDSIIGTSLLLPVRGGLIEPKPPQQVSSWSKTQAAFLDILPASRLHFSLILFATLVHLAGLPAPALFSLDFSKIFTQLQLWRPLTAVAYLGPPSMSWANHLYFLLKFGQALEQSTGTATHMWFLLVQATLLSALGLVFNFPFQAQAMIAAVVYSWSRLSPLQPMNFQFGVKISAWHLPFCLAAIDCLSKQSLAAAWPHAMGMLSAHLFHFSRDIVGQQQQLQQRQRQPTKDSAASSAPLLLAQLFRTPQWLLKRFPPPRSNTELDFRDTSSSSSSSSSSSNSGNRRSKQKTRGTGNILGSSL